VSAYLLGASSDALNHIYEAESKSLDPWKDSPGEISLYDWRDYLGKREYERAFIDFFEDQLVQHGYDWKAVVSKFILAGPEPLVNNLVCGLGHPLIHLGYAYEIESKEVAMEALGLASTNYNYLHKYLDNPDKYQSPNTSTTSTSPLELFQIIHSDSRFSGLFETPGSDNLTKLFDEHESLVLEYWHAWSITSPTTQFKDSQHAAVALLVGSVPDPEKSKYDFFFVHLLTTSHAIRILLPFLPAKFHIPVVKQWWLITAALYMAQLRPYIDLKSIEDFDLKGRGWKDAEKVAVEGKYRTDAHYVKAVRSMKEAASTWGDDDGFYEKAAVKFAEGFTGWGGFGATDIDEMEGYD
jgi:hypothetical protein